MPRTRSIRHRIHREQRGQDLVEYVGALAIIALIVGAIAVLGLPSTVSHAIKCSVYSILRLGPCDAAQQAAQRYPVSVTVKTVGWNGRVAIVDSSHTYTLKLTVYSDGTSQLSSTDDGSAGVSARAGFHADAGKIGIDATATAGADLYGANTITWNLPSKQLGEKYFNQLGNTSGAALAGHDLASDLGLGGVYDWATGTSGPPDTGSLPKKYLGDTSVEGGLQGTASAEAEANLGLVHAGASVDATLRAGLQRIDSGPQKGDWVYRESLDASGSGGLAAALFGPHADAYGGASGELTVTFSPDLKPLTADVTGTIDGTWGAGLSSSSPTGSSDQFKPGEGGSESSAGKAGAAGAEQSAGAGSDPVLSADSNEGKGGGTTFQGTIDLTAYPADTADIGQALLGNSTGIQNTITDFNRDGVETIQHFGFEQSTSKYGAGIDAGVGVDAGTTDSTSNMDYQAPQVRDHGGPWHTGSDNNP